jgi:transcriptional regulator with XRE-family HTH domain
MEPPTGDQLDTFARVLGDELRMVRRSHNWTRKQLQARLSPDDEVSLQMLATYELGTRRMTVERLVEICAALDHPPDQLLRRANERAFAALKDDSVVVDLSALARTADPRLVQLQRWAAIRANQLPPGIPVVETLDDHALAALANLAGTTPNQIAYALHDLQPTSS